MATKRSLSTILGLLADNTTGDIGAEDVQDSIVTISPDGGAMYIVSAIETSITDSVSYFPVLGTWALSIGNDWDMNVNGQLRYTGAASRFTGIFATMTMSSASSNQELEFVVLKNGTAQAPSVVDRKTGTGGDLGAAAIFLFTTVATNDYFQIGVKNNTSTANMTMVHSHMGAIGFAI